MLALSMTYIVVFVFNMIYSIYLTEYLRWALYNKLTVYHNGMLGSTFLFNIMSTISCFYEANVATVYVFSDFRQTPVRIDL